MLKTLRLPNMLAFRKNNDNDKVIEFDIDRDINRLLN